MRLGRLRRERSLLAIANKDGLGVKTRFLLFLQEVAKGTSEDGIELFGDLILRHIATRQGLSPGAP